MKNSITKAMERLQNAEKVVSCISEIIVNPVTAVFLEAGGVSSILSLLISDHMANKALEILEDLGLEG